MDRCALNARIARVVIDLQHDVAIQDEIGVDNYNCVMNMRAWWIVSSISYWWERVLYFIFAS